MIHLFRTSSISPQLLSSFLFSSIEYKKPKRNELEPGVSDSIQNSVVSLARIIAFAAYVESRPSPLHSPRYYHNPPRRGRPRGNLEAGGEPPKDARGLGVLVSTDITGAAVAATRCWRRGYNWRSCRTVEALKVEARTH